MPALSCHVPTVLENCEATVNQKRINYLCKSVTRTDCTTSDAGTFRCVRRQLHSVADLRSYPHLLCLSIESKGDGRSRGYICKPPGYFYLQPHHVWAEKSLTTAKKAWASWRCFPTRLGPVGTSSKRCQSQREKSLS